MERFPPPSLVHQSEIGYTASMHTERLPHDPAYKQFFSNREMVASLLRDFVTEDFIADLDFSTLEHCAGSYVADDLRERHDDVIWRVRWKGSWCYVYLLLEFQSAPDPWMAVRILTYTALLWQDLIKKGVVRDNEPLPPVLPVVIYNGGRAWTAARDVAELLAPIPGPLAAYQPRQRYFLLDESRVPEDVLRGSGGLAAQLLRLERAHSLDDIRPIVGELLEQLRAPEYLHLRRIFSVWMARVVFKRAGITRDVPEFQDLQEVDAMLEERAAQWAEEYKRQGLLAGLEEGLEKGMEKGMEKGLEKGMEKGREEALRGALSDLLEDRFGSLPAPVAADIAETSDPQDLRRLARSVYKVPSLQAFVELLEQTVKDKKHA